MFSTIFTQIINFHSVDATEANGVGKIVNDDHVSPN